MNGPVMPEQLLADEYGAQSTAGDNPIPIDPALEGPPIDPELLVPPEDSSDTQPHPDPPGAEEPSIFSQYSQAPQGLPFQDEPEYEPLQLDANQPPAPISPTPKARSRKRHCNKCTLPVKNSKAQSERAVTCPECDTTSHIDCLTASGIRPRVWDVTSTYDWVCAECKKCEICHEKGDDAKVLFCDACDRGWHMDCLEPAVESTPKDDWFCPMCPDAVPTEREMSVASSSGGAGSSRASKGKGKARARSSDDEDSEEGEEASVAVSQPVSVSRSKARQKSPKKRANGQPSPSRSPAKRIRIQPPHPAPSKLSVRLRLPPKDRGKKVEEEEPPRGLFDDILAPTERDTTKTAIAPPDKQKFDRSRAIAEAKLKPPPPPRPMQASETPEAGPSSRPLRSSNVQQPLASPSASPAPSSTSGVRPTHDPSVPAPLRITHIRFGQYDIETWYNAPFPEEYSNIPDGRLWICEFCLKYMKSRFGSNRHRMKCKCRNPPGDEIYRDQAVSIFEVDGRKNKIYCQNLCLLSKMFLDHKSLFYDVEPFLFYVMTEVDDMGARFVGYFSKEKRSPKDYNVSCIMTLPVRQRQGWGNLLIDFSYLLSKKEHRLGSPEKPLSGLGALGYKNYWLLAVMRYLSTAPDHPRLEDICLATSMTMEDVHATLTQQNLITVRDVTPPRIKPSPGQSIKYPKGRKNGIARRHLQRTQTKDKANDAESDKPFVAPMEYEISWDRDTAAEYLRNWESKGYLQLKPEKLQWSPYVLATMNKTEAISAADTSTLLTTERLAAKRADGLPLLLRLTSQELFGALKEDNEDEQMERDRAFAASLATDTPRTLRSRSNLSITTTPVRTPALTPRRGRGRPPGSSRKKVLEVAEEEQESEEEHEGKRRRLRSHEASSPNKRQRVESSPEEPHTEEGPPSTPPPLTTSSHRTPSPTCAQESSHQANGLDTRRLVCDEPNRTAPVIKTIKMEEIEVPRGGAMATIAAAWQRASQSEEDGEQDAEGSVVDVDV
ncbi:hypothetical protein C8F01DRAFT_1154218 [Mycena amicta]|nr:hypothetical protein C8F01DRAFT_1154218 [Mycena amicta]